MTEEEIRELDRLPQAHAVTEANDPALRLYRDMTEAQLRRSIECENGVFIAESPTVIDVALDEGCVPLSLLCDRRRINEDVLRVISRCHSAPLYLAPHDVTTAITGFALTRGALCAFRRPEPKTAEEVTRGRTAWRCWKA